MSNDRIVLACLVCLAGISGPADASAQPAMATSVLTLTVSQEECRSRVEPMLSSAGYAVSGDFGDGMHGRNADTARSVSVSCLHGPGDQSAVSIVVAGADPQPEAERLMRLLRDGVRSTAQAGAPLPGSGKIFAADWNTQAEPWRGRTGERFRLACPPHGVTSDRLWGTGIYSDDSSVCTAAVHAGLITAAEGGTVTITIAPGRPFYSGKPCHGIISRDYGEFPGSFTFEGAAESC